MNRISFLTRGYAFKGLLAVVNLHLCICKNKICIWSDPGVNLPVCKYTPVCICVRMRHLLTPSKICTPEYIYTRVFLAHANWTIDNRQLVVCLLKKTLMMDLVHVIDLG